MDPIAIHIRAIDVLLAHSGLSEEELLNRCMSVTQQMLASIRRSGFVFPEDIADITQALRVPRRVLTDVSGNALELYFLAHRILEEFDRLDDVDFYEFIIEHKYAARNTDGYRIDLDSVRTFYREYRSDR